ncbi:regulatory protein RecX [Paenibacillus spiritus]|uniref:Regulatory protein RecX n=1 Tax=Paenibacillus spiritus TaxID=2496557 RepID=A0A5J5GEP2_9BACL|nr:RecX family transcriptional regulator [Paenibacillus spiritus]KAA9006460.1 regulatory protein RecX [Paenibacillus spiritus]
MVIQLNPEPEEEKEDPLLAFPEHTELEITRVERMKKSRSRYIIYFGEIAVPIHEDIMIKYRMMSGRSFGKTELLEIIQADERQRAYAEGLRYLESKPRTAVEISRRLRQKEFSESVVEVAVERLTRERFVDDRQYASRWAEQRITGHRKGKLWVRQELREKGIEKSLIAEALEGISEEEEFDGALQLGRRKWSSSKGEAIDRRRKTGAYLMRRGYSGDIVRRVLNELRKLEAEEGEEEIEDFY